MKMISIVGGGLAGLTLGIALRRRRVPVEIIEAGHYPRHRVCGEFINGRGLRVLDELEMTGRLMEAGGRRALTAVFHSTGRASPVRRLPESALCVSRYVLDAELAGRFTDLGGHLVEGSRWTETFEKPGVVRATGRRVRSVENGSRWFGVKAHARNLELAADLEMHFGRRGYVGICRVERDRANVCGLFRRPPSVAGNARNLADSFCDEGESDLRRRLAGVDWDEASVCTVGGLPIHVGLRPVRAGLNECSIGDAAAMIPPVTGNGMSMAFESAALAAGVVAEYSQGRLEWEECCGNIASSQRQAFRRRLGWANLLHRGLFHERWGRLLLSSASGSQALWRLFFATTR